jgi:hypothetical protein
MSAETSNDPFAAILNRYGPIQAAQSLSQRLTTTEIAELAYPNENDVNDRIQMVIRLGKAIDREELASCGIAPGRLYLGGKRGPPQPMVDRVAFARFLTALGATPSGRLAEWIAQPDESAGLPADPPPSSIPPRGTPGPKQSAAMASAIQEAIALVASGRPKKTAAMVVGEKYKVNSDSVLRAIQRKRNSQ